MSPRNYKQAEVPDTCTVLMNEKGTAPGMMFKRENKIFVAMPGVPHEMKWIMQTYVLPDIIENYQSGYVEHKTLITAGIGESSLADFIKDIEDTIPAYIKLAYLPNFGMVRLRLTGFGNDKEVLLNDLNKYFVLLKDRVSEYLVTDVDLPLEAVVGKLLKESNQTVSTAESCTGGLIGHLISSVPGASAYYKGSIVSYSNEIKSGLLKVSEATLSTYGAVSEETVMQMATEVLKLMNTDFSIAVSGIMCPDGGTVDKPVGTVWIAVASQSNVITKMFHLPFDRQRNVQQTVINSLDFLRKQIVDKKCG